MIRALAERADALAAGGRAVVGIAGSPGAGKSTLARWLVEELEDGGTPAAVLPMDGFHLSAAELAERGLSAGKGAPETFDVDAYLALLREVRNGQGLAVMAPDYDRELHEVVPGRLMIGPRVRVVVTEGNYLGLDTPPWNRVAPLLDELWFVEAPWELARERLIARRMATGRERDDAVAWVDSVDAANAALIAPTVDRARVVLRPEDY
ncbi:nucleoside/nucleotide kinase family protein [Demequina sp.]|uniref:nucleoside/nucleotide kinase family protein n=1 Tax=Demequina sp. TaxID=2050685 RepID=UPI0025DC6805|nr:nucleoside/nucleotide kinase family protein [Demequina sp.]